MLSPSQDSIPTQKTLRPKLRQEDVIHQMQSELLNLVQVTPDETTENWQKLPLHLGNGSGTLESEISSFLW